MKSTAAKPKSDHYHFRRLIAENPLALSWEAVRKGTDRVCFVKTPNPSSPIDRAQQESILLESLSCQRFLKSPRVHTALDSEKGLGRFAIEYPWLSPERWEVLTPDLLIGKLSMLLPEMFVLVDYLHMLGLVHCDLKLDNFLVRQQGEGYELRLIDMDFLCRDDSSPKGTVFGTPDHIAPEILNDDRVYHQSDSYSLGVSLNRAIVSANTSEDIADLPDEVQALRRMTQTMTREDPLQRPRALLPALEEFGLIDADTGVAFERRLTGMVLVSHFRRCTRSSLTGPDQIARFLKERAGFFGVPREFIEYVAEIYAQSPLKAINIFARIPSEADLVRVVGYRQATLSDDLATDLLSGMLGELKRPWLEALPSSIDSPEELEVEVALAADHREAGRILTGYFRIREAYARIQADSSEEWKVARRTALAELESLARQGGRFHDAVRHKLELLELIDDPLEYRRQENDLGFLWLYVGDREEAGKIYRRLIDDPLVKEEPELWRQVLRRMASIDIERGNFDTLHQVEKTLSPKTGMGPWETVVTCRALSQFQSDRGRFEEGRAYAERGLTVARQGDLLARAVPLLGNLIFANFSLGEYGICCKLARKTNFLLRHPERAYLKPGYAGRGANAAMRLCDRNSAMQRLGERREAIVKGDQLKRLGVWYQSMGFVLQNFGDIELAREYSLLCLELPEGMADSHTVGKASHVLAECAYYQGRLNECRAFVKSGLDIFKRMDSETDVIELETILAIAELYHAPDRDSSGLMPLLEALTEARSCYYAVLCGYHILLNGSESERERVFELLAAFGDVLEEERVPLFRAVGALSQAHRLGNPGLEYVTSLKDAFRAFDRSGARFLALVTALKISDVYISREQDPLARKFLDQAERTARGLDNNVILDRIASRKTSLTAGTDLYRRLVRVMLGISEIVKNITDYEESLRALVKFAVLETGAERGAILTNWGRNEPLQVAAYFNCDEDSLTDIQDFSSSVPLEATRDLEPMVVEDALNDARTRGYKSVISNNILSVICVPIVVDDTVYGALYLDHHAISALFSPEDVSYIKAIANFLAPMLTAAREYRKESVKNRELIASLKQSGDHSAFVTQDPVLLDLLEGLPEIARSDASILITGESGTGKEILARKIHELSGRHDQPLVQLNCSALPESLVESELFGVAKGAATDVREREGKFAAADNGTLFLDEIGDLPLLIQPKLLRAVEQRQFERVGSNRTMWCDVRFVSATNRDLDSEVRAGRFRRDLYHRINTVTLEIQPLRERPGDIRLLVDHFLKLFSIDREPPQFTSAAIQAMMNYDWPGNVRELRNLVERFSIVSPGHEIGINQLPAEMRRSRSDSVYAREKAEADEKAAIIEALIKTKGNQSAASRHLNMALSTMRRRIKKYGLEGLL